MLPSIQWATLITLIALRKLILWRDVKIAWSNSKLLHVGLWVDIGYTLSDVTSASLLILRLREILPKLAEVSMFTTDHCIVYQLLTLWRWRHLAHIILVNILMSLLLWTRILLFYYRCILILLMVLVLSALKTSRIISLQILILLILLLLLILSLSLLILMSLWLKIITLLASVTVLAAVWS